MNFFKIKIKKRFVILILKMEFYNFIGKKIKNNNYFPLKF
jgi:hypothetical protein